MSSDASSKDTWELARAVGRYTWYHTLELGQGVVTPGMFDHRPVVNRYLLPDELSEKRCLDVGTMDGFWAFEMERRGAVQVVAIDLDDPETLDWPVSIRAKAPKTLGLTNDERFRLAHRQLRSKVERKTLSVYDLSPDILGTFDLVFCGDLLVHLKDPITAVERIRSVCRGSAVLCTPIVKLRFGRRRALAVLDGIENFQWWVFTMSALERLALSAGFSRVPEKGVFRLPARTGGQWEGRRGVIRALV